MSPRVVRECAIVMTVRSTLRLSRISPIVYYNINTLRYHRWITIIIIIYYIERYWYARLNIITKHNETRLAPVPVRLSGSDDARPSIVSTPLPARTAINYMAIIIINLLYGRRVRRLRHRRYHTPAVHNIYMCTYYR